jgi:hypothetical protein
MYALEKNGLYFAYRRGDGTMMKTTDMRFVRVYRTLKGARIASWRYAAFTGQMFTPFKLDIPGSANLNNARKKPRRRATAAAGESGSLPA